jgi:uncharacterized protein (TIGR02246 family)
MTRVVRIAVLALAGVGALVGCEQSQQTEASESSKLAAVHAVADSFAESYRAGDAEAFANLFTEEAIYGANNGQLLQGREEILAAARQWVKVPQEPTRETLRAEVAGGVVYLFERYANEVRMPNAPVQTVTGKSLAVFREQQDGSWKIEALVVNRDPPERE